MTQTAYQLRVSIRVPEKHIDDANQLAVVLGESIHDDRTFTSANYQDEAGNLYALCSTVAKPVFADKAGQPLQPPSFAPDADIEAATRAQALLVIGTLDEPPQAGPDQIAVIVGHRLESAQDHIAAMGLTPIPTEGDQP